jgi:outer membrane protein assembly factor BamB
MGKEKTVCWFGRRGWAVVGLALLLAGTIVIAGCGGSSSSSSSTTSTSESEPESPVPAAETESAATSAEAAAGWESPNADLHNTRSVQSEIEASNVNELGVAWTLPIKGTGTKPGQTVPAFGQFAANSVVVDGQIYTQDLSSNVYSISQKTGEVEWYTEFDSPSAGPNGVNYGEGMIFGTTADSVFALDAKTGKQLWIQKLTRNHKEGVDMAPGFNEGTVYVSTVPGSDEGFYEGEGVAILWAIDAKTGKAEWKWDEVPKNLWGSQKNSGGGQWQPPSFDSEGNLYIGVANPAPYNDPEEPNAESRPGPDLYTDSIVKLNGKTGKLMWYYQLDPHDVHDWDMNNGPILMEAEGKPIVVDAGKAGIVVAVEQETGKLIWKTPVGEHNGHDEDNKLAEEGKLKYTEMEKMLPGTFGGVESPMATDGKYIYAGVNNLPIVIGGEGLELEGTGEMVALDPATGKVVWDKKLPTSNYGGATVSNDVVYTTTFEGTVWGFETETGKLAWKSKLPAGTNATVLVDGSTLFTAGSYPQGADQKAEFVAYELGATGVVEEAKPTKTEGNGAEPAPANESSSEEGGSSKMAGAEVFSTNCAECHTLAAASSTGTVGPNLDALSPSDPLVVHQVTGGGGGMPAFGGQLSKEEIESVAEYVSSDANKNAAKSAAKPSTPNGP